jgi:hypothetical protein
MCVVDLRSKMRTATRMQYAANFIDIQTAE